jgi:hypothetical protein
VYSLIVSSYIERLIDQGIDKPGLLIRYLNIPPLIFTAMALVVFLIYCLKGLYNSSDN